MTETATVEKKPRVKKGDGPVVLSFTDGTEKFNRVNEKATAVQVEDKAGKAAKFALSELPPAMINGLAMENLKKRIDSFVRAGFDPTKNNVMELATEAFQRLMDGKLYAKTGAAKKEGGQGQKGRPFDIELWVETITIAWKQKTSTELSPDQAASLRVKLEAMDKADRAKAIKTYLADKVIAAAHLAAKYNRVKADVKSGKDSEKAVDLGTLF